MSFPIPNANQPPGDDIKPQRRQVKRACTACRKAHTACSATLPCRRCIRLGRAALCIAGQLPPPKLSTKKKRKTFSSSVDKWKRQKSRKAHIVPGKLAHQGDCGGSAPNIKGQRTSSTNHMPDNSSSAASDGDPHPQHDECCSVNTYARHRSLGFVESDDEFAKLTGQHHSIPMEGAMHQHAQAQQHAITVSNASPSNVMHTIGSCAPSSSSFVSVRLWNGQNCSLFDIEGSTPRVLMLASIGDGRREMEHHHRRH